MPRKQKKHHYIYKTTNVKNGKYYIGMHSTDDLNDGYIGSGKRLWNSINYHGKENHVCEILEYCKDRKELRRREEEIVNEQLLNEDLCMNLVRGGQGGIFDEEHHKKMREGASKWIKNKWKDEKFRNKISKAVSEDNINKHKLGVLKPVDWTGKKHSDETKQKISESRKKKGNDKFKKPVICYDLEGNILKHYSSIKKTEEDGFSSKSVSDVVVGRRKTHKGFIFKYEH